MSSISPGNPQGLAGNVTRKPAAPPKPPKPAGVAAAGRGPSFGEAAQTKKAPPKVPAKKAAGGVDLLDSLEGNADADVGGWETLKPTG